MGVYMRVNCKYICVKMQENNGLNMGVDTDVNMVV